MLLLSSQELWKFVAYSYTVAVEGAYTYMHACSKQDEALALAVLCMAMELLYLPMRWTGSALL